MSPSALAVDYLTGNLYIATVSDDESGLISRRRKRMSEPIINTRSGGGGGAIFVTKSDGRYARKIVDGHLQVPTAIVTAPQIGRICYADAGSAAKIECADMDGKHREVIVNELIYSPTSMAIDEGKENRIYWADPKYHMVESILPDGTKRTTIVHDKKTPWSIDVFENNLYWASKESRDLHVQDKFGRGRSYVLASGISDVHSVRIQQKYARDVARTPSPCAEATCSHICTPLPHNGYSCLCPDKFTLLNDGSCVGTQVDELPLPKQCACQNGGTCRVDGTCDCGDFEGEYCEKASTVSRQLIGRFGNVGILAVLLVLALAACLGIVVFLAVNLYKRRLLLFKKNEAADGAVSFHGNVISFSNPVLDHKPGDATPVEYNMTHLDAAGATSTTFSNPVYELGEDTDASPSTSSQPSSSRPQSFTSADVRPEPASSVIAPSSDLLRGTPTIPPRRAHKTDGDKAQLVENQEITDV